MRDVSEQLDISYSYFYHVFREIMGEPYWQYVKRHRLELAAGLIRHSGYNISEISDRCGYSTIAAFTKAFSSHFGESPRSFRKINELPNEKRTLEITRIITDLYARNGAAINDFFSYERAEHVVLPDTVLYYTLISHGQNPIEDMVTSMDQHEKRFREILSFMDLPQAKVITGTLDAVPVTNYEKLVMYAGISIPLKDTQAHVQLMERTRNLIQKRVPGGNYLRLQVPIDFASAGIPMYDFITRYCREGVFKMSGNHFFISLVEPRLSEIYIPYLKQLR